MDTLNVLVAGEAAAKYAGKYYHYEDPEQELRDVRYILPKMEEALEELKLREKIIVRHLTQNDNLYKYIA